jgi:acetoin utilization deacetylase AcuC-like enzyme
MWSALLERLGVVRRGLSLWHDASYWLPISVAGRYAVEPRRADFVAWYLNDHFSKQITIHTPTKIPYQTLQLVHSRAYLESLQDASTLAHIFGLHGEHIPVDELLRSMRMACGATLAAAHYSLAYSQPMLNLLGGFHHAAPEKGGGFCVFNDVAVAIAALRADGFKEQIAILDLDAHPPDGTARCLANDTNTWLGSLSGSFWEPLPNVDETFLPARCNDDTYLTALDALLSRMPASSLYFIIAGGDVLLDDSLGLLGMTIQGARQRDLMVISHIKERPSVWLPAGGYHADSWKLLAGTALALLGQEEHWVPASYQPITERFSAIAKQLNFPEDKNWLGLTQEDLEGSLHKTQAHPEKLLQFYTKEGAEYALVQYGLWERLEQLGYKDLQLSFEAVPLGDRFMIRGFHEGEHLLVDCVLSSQQVAGERAIFVHWLQLRHPIAKRTNIPKHTLLPGQDAPGLGLSREVGELFRQMSLRIGAAGVALCPAWYHVAFSARQDFHFVDPERQGRFDALVRDLGGLHTKDVSVAIAEGRVFCNDTPYQWEATEMVSWRQFSAEEQEQMLATREASHFRLV